MNTRSFASMALTALLAFVLGAAGVALAQQSGPGSIATPPPPPQKFICESDSSTCHCKGAADCVDLKNSGQCAGAITAKEVNASCTWIGPPKTPEPTAMIKRPAAKLAAGAPKPPVPYACEYSGKKVKGCICRNVGDCLKLDDSKLCGSNAIVDNQKVPGAGTCGDWM